MKRLCILFLLASLALSSRGASVRYLGLQQNDDCTYSENPPVTGTCVRAQDCIEELYSYRNGTKDFKLCSASPRSSIICCPPKVVYVPQTLNTKRHSLDFLACQKQHSLFSSGTTINTIQGQGLAYNGQLAEKREWKDIAAIGWTQSNRKINYHCGGAIIHERIVLTAAHCSRFERKEPDTVRVGDRFLLHSQDNEHAQQLKIEKIIVHPDFSSVERYNDIAIIRTKQTIKFNNFVLPACIPDKVEPLGTSIRLKSGGFGETERQRGSSNVLNAIDVTVITNERCNTIFKNSPRAPRGIIDGQICTKGAKVGEETFQDTCYGDSGSPVQYTSENELKISWHQKTVYEIPVLLGLVSFGIDCGYDVPSVNTRVPHYRDWIERIINEVL